MEGAQVVFRSNQLPVSGLVCVIYKVSTALDPGQTFSSLTLKCRKLLFEFCGQVAVSPLPDSCCLMVVCPQSLVTSDQYCHLVSRLQLTVSITQEVSPGLLAQCLSFTLQAWTAPSWNRVGDWLLQGRQFLHSADPIPAVKAKVNVADSCIEIALRASRVSFPLMTPEDVGVTMEMADMFMTADKSATLTEQQFGCQYVLVLPRLSKARLMSISKQLPTQSKFSEWSQMKRYWKNMYGYRLGSHDSEEPLVYYNVSFYGSNSVLSYPEWCVRKLEPRPLPRINPRPIMETFLKDLVNNNATLFGVSLSFHSQPINLSNRNIVPCSDNKTENVGWTQPTGPIRELDQTMSQQTQHSQGWKITDQGDSFKQGNCAGVKSVVFNSSDDSGYETQSTCSPSMCQPRARIKPTFMSKLMSTPQVTRPSKPNFLSGTKLPGPGSRPLSVSSETTNESLESVKVPTFSPSNPTAPLKPNFSRLLSVKPESQLKPKQKIPCEPSSSSSIIRKKSTVAAGVNIDQLLSHGKTKEISKLNVATLLDYCRRTHLTEAKAKTKKEDLLNLIFSNNNKKM